VEETHLFLVINASTPHSLSMTELTKLNLVQLAGDGSNWVSYWDHLTITLKMKRWQEHLTEDAVTQAYNDRGTINGIAPGMRWEDDDQAVKHVIMNSVLDEVFNRIKGGASAKAWWDSLKTICEGRSRSLLIDLGRKLQNTYCGDNNDICVHFAKLTNIREQLAAMGQSVADQQYANILLASLPHATKCASALSQRMLMKPHTISTLQESSSLLATTMTSGCSLGAKTMMKTRHLLSQDKRRTTATSSVLTARRKATSKPIVGQKEVEKKVRGQIDESLKTKTRASIQSPQLQTK